MREVGGRGRRAAQGCKCVSASLVVAQRAAVVVVGLGENVLQLGQAVPLAQPAEDLGGTRRAASASASGWGRVQVGDGCLAAHRLDALKVNLLDLGGSRRAKLLRTVLQHLLLLAGEKGQHPGGAGSGRG